VVLEEFCAERIDRATATWLAGVARGLVEAGDAEPGGIEDPDEVLTRWAQVRREHGLRTGAEMWAALEARFLLGVPTWVPSLWVEVARRVPDPARAEVVAELVEGSEASLIAAGTLPGVSFRAAGTVR
jgi:hypothetical protein